MNVKNIPARHVFTLLCCLAFFNMYSLRINMSVAIVAMVREKETADLQEVQEEDTCASQIPPDTNLTDVIIKSSTHANISRLMQGEFEWDSTTRGQILASYFYGYIFTQIPSGVLADKYGGKGFMGLGMLAASVATLLTPVFTRWGVGALIALRVFVGVSQGIGFPAARNLISQWAPKMERSRITTVASLGVNLGNAVAFSLSGFLCDSQFFGGWPSVFYVFGTMGCISFTLWATLVFESPEEHPRISKEELEYIITSRDRGKTKKQDVPWRSILKSKAVWALFFTHSCFIWGFVTFLVELPSYLANVLRFNISNNGCLSALPQLLFMLSSISSSVVADKMRKSGRLHITVIRKIFNSIGCFGAAICLFGVTFSGCKLVLIVVLLSVALLMLGCLMTGYNATYVDMSPEFSGVLFGISNTLAALCSLLVPNYAGWILKDGQTKSRWNIIFLTAASLLTVSGVAFDVFCTAERQDWAKLSQNHVNGDLNIEKTEKKNIFLKKDETI